MFDEEGGGWRRHARICALPALDLWPRRLRTRRAAPCSPVSSLPCGCDRSALDVGSNLGRKYVGPIQDLERLVFWLDDRAACAKIRIVGRGKGRQAAFRFRTWGGSRNGAGRKPASRRRRREVLKPRWPVHVTLRCVREVGRLRKFKLYQRLREAMAGAGARLDYSIFHFSVQGDHIHLICESRSERALSNGKNRR